MTASTIQALQASKTVATFGVLRIKQKTVKFDQFALMARGSHLFA
jgi:hypothetical protein